MNFKTYADLQRDIRKNVALLNSRNFDLVVGVPRSGMIPAYMIALLLNIDCTDLPSFVANTPLGRGRRAGKNDVGHINSPSEAKSILLVDDSIRTGCALRQALASIPPEAKDRITTLAVYGAELRHQEVDIMLEHLPVPRAFEWNLFHHTVLRQACVDIDGVLCEDPTPKENDDGDAYREFILNARPKILPTKEIFALVSSRLEKYRPETEAWLKRHKVNYKNLIMLDLPTKEDRVRSGVHAVHKANYFRGTEALLFIESEDWQAQEISRISGKIVYCLRNNAIYVAGRTEDLVTDRAYCIDGRRVGLGGLVLARMLRKLRHAVRGVKHIASRREGKGLIGR